MKLLLEKHKPFVKWAGGKRQIVDLLVACMPSKHQTYVEPFVDVGALFFEVQPRRAIIGDINCIDMRSREKPESVITSYEPCLRAI